MKIKPIKNISLKLDKQICTLSKDKVYMVPSEFGWRLFLDGLCYNGDICVNGNGEIVPTLGGKEELGTVKLFLIKKGDKITTLPIAEVVNYG